MHLKNVSQLTRHPFAASVHNIHSVAKRQNKLKGDPLMEKNFEEKSHHAEKETGRETV